MHNMGTGGKTVLGLGFGQYSLLYMYLCEGMVVFSYYFKEVQRAFSQNAGKGWAGQGIGCKTLYCDNYPVKSHGNLWVMKL